MILQLLKWTANKYVHKSKIQNEMLQIMALNKVDVS